MIRDARRPWMGPTKAGWVLTIVAAAGSVLPSLGARAQSATPRTGRRILLLVESPGDPFMARIKAEIASLGLEVVVRAPTGSIESSARSERAVAAIRMVPSRNGVEVWMADETSGRSLLRQAIVDETPGGPNQNLIALQTVELLRTSLFPHRPSGPAAPLPPPPAIVQVAPAPSPSGDSGLATSVGLLFSVGGTSSPAWQAWFSFQQLWRRRFGMSVELSVPLHRGAMSGPEGAAEVGAITAGTEAFLRFNSGGGRLFLTTGLGAALAWVLAKGHPNQQGIASLVSTSSTAYTGLGYARANLGWECSRWLGVGLSAFAGTTIARVRVRFAGNDAGEWGVPLWGAGVFGLVRWR